MEYVGGYTLVLDMTDMDLIYEKVREVIHGWMCCYVCYFVKIFPATLM